VALHHAHQLLLHRVEGGIHPRCVDAVEVVHVINDDVVNPLPPARAPRLRIVLDEIGGDVDRLREPVNTLIMVPDADCRLRERGVPFLDAGLRQLVLILRPWSLGVVGVKRDRVPIGDVTNEHHLVAPLTPIQIGAEGEIAGVTDRLVNIPNAQNFSHETPPFFVIASAACTRVDCDRHLCRVCSWDCSRPGCSCRRCGCGLGGFRFGCPNTG
jgi:hypothetical protein